MSEGDTLESFDSVRLKRIKGEIKTIGDRSTWLLGFLTIIIAGLTSFLFQGLSAIIADTGFVDLKPAVLALLFHYLLITLIMLLVQMASFLVFDDEIMAPTGDVRVNGARLKKIKIGYRVAMSLAILPLFSIFGFAIYFSYI